MQENNNIIDSNDTNTTPKNTSIVPFDTLRTL